MNELHLSDTQIKAAFMARAEGTPSHDLTERIGFATRRARQQPRLLVLPGGVGVDPQRLLWAAAISATSLALVGGLLIAGRQPDDQAVVPPSVGPTPSPTVAPAPTDVPSPTPSAEPTPAPTTSDEPTPNPVDPGLAVDSPAITLVGDLRVRSLPTVDESSERLEPLLPADVRLLVIEEPVVADGYTWYHVLPFEPGYPRGWVAAGSREGASWITADDIACPEAPLDATSLIELGVYGGLACYGNDTIEVTGEVQCAQADVDNSIRGPSWIQSGSYCAFMVDGAPAYSIHPDPGNGVEVPYPYDYPIVTVMGHFADSQSESCEWAVDPPAPDPREVDAMCRAMFVATDMVVQPIDTEG